MGYFTLGTKCPTFGTPNVTGKEIECSPTGTRTQGLSLTVLAILLLSYRATWSAHYNFPLLNKICPRICSEPCWNLLDSLFAARSPSMDPHTGHQMSQARKKNVARPGLEPRVFRLPCKHAYHCATEPHDQPITDETGEKC